MQIRIHLPRKSEADIRPDFKQDIVVTPKFYKKSGTLPVFYFTTVDSKGKEDYHVMLINAATKNVRVEKLVEVVPLCDEEVEDDTEEEKAKDTETPAG